MRFNAVMLKKNNKSTVIINMSLKKYSTTTISIINFYSYNGHIKKNNALLTMNRAAVGKCRRSMSIATNAGTRIWRNPVSSTSSICNNLVCSRRFSSLKKKKLLEQKNSSMFDKVVRGAKWLIKILGETREEAKKRREGEFLERTDDVFFIDTLSPADLEEFKKDPVNFRLSYTKNLKKNIDLHIKFESMTENTEKNEAFLKSKMTPEQVAAWDAAFNSVPKDDPRYQEKFQQKAVKIAQEVTVLQNRKILEEELRHGTVNPFVRPKVEGDPVELDDLAMESRVITEEHDPVLDDPLVHVDHRKPVGSGLVTNYQASRFYEYFSKKNPLPEGYFYFNETAIVDPSEVDIVSVDVSGKLQVDSEASKHLVLRSLYADTLQASTDSAFTEEDRVASVRSIGGYEIREHFDLSMIRKTPENLVLLEDDTFLKDFNVDIEKLKSDEAERLELLIADTADSAKARPINKHVAFFRKSRVTQAVVDEFIDQRTAKMKYLKAKDASGENYFWRFVTWLGYPSAWRSERYASWEKFLAEREARKRREAAERSAFEKLELTETGEIPDPEPIPDEFNRRYSFDKPAYFERRNAKYPGRYNNSWYDLDIVDLLEPPYNHYEHFTFAIFELLERAYSEALKDFVPSNDFLPFEPTVETTWLDPSVAEMIESDFALLPGHRMQEWYSLFYGRWDDTLYTSDYQRCVDLYEDLVRMHYPRYYWWDSYPLWVKKVMLWLDIFLHTFFLIHAVVWLNIFSFFTYVFFCSTVELTRWD